MCSLISTAIPPCHHFPSFPPLCPYWVISISPSTLIFQKTIPLKSTQNNVSPPNSFQRHPLPLYALQRENPFIFDSRLSRNGSNVCRNHDKCNQAGFWWANGWTRAPLLCQEWYYIWQLCHIFLKSFSLISRQKALLTFRSIFLFFHTFLSKKGLKMVFLFLQMCCFYILSCVKNLLKCIYLDIFYKPAYINMNVYILSYLNKYT